MSWIVIDSRLRGNDTFTHVIVVLNARALYLSFLRMEESMSWIVIDSRLHGNDTFARVIVVYRLAGLFTLRMRSTCSAGGVR